LRKGMLEVVVYHVKYFLTLLLHKAFIFLVGTWVNWRLVTVQIPYHRLIFHDWVKFLPAELFPYAFRQNGPYDKENKAHVAYWDEAWKHHYTAMDHHWQFHVTGYAGDMTHEQIQKNARRIPEDAVLEIPIDLISSALGYHWEWPGPTWGPLDTLHETWEYHPLSRLHLCVIWHRLGFSIPLSRLTNSENPQEALGKSRQLFEELLEDVEKDQRIRDRLKKHFDYLTTDLTLWQKILYRGYLLVKLMSAVLFYFVLPVVVLVYICNEFL